MTNNQALRNALGDALAALADVAVTAKAAMERANLAMQEPASEPAKQSECYCQPTGEGFFVCPICKPASEAAPASAPEGDRK